jgi:hypothetical protein
VIPFAEDVAAADLPRVHEMMDGLLVEEERLADAIVAVGGDAS